MNSFDWEFTASDGNVYYCSASLSETGSGEVESFEIKDDLGEDLSEEHEMYSECYDDIYSKEFEVEYHDGSFDFYDQHLDHLGVNKFSLNDV